MKGVVQGAALGAVFEVLIRLFLDATRKVVRFSSDLNRLTSTLSSIKRAVDDIQNIHTIRESEKVSFNDCLIEAEKLIQKCSQVKYWNIFSRWYYSMKLQNKLEALLLNYFLINAAAFHTRESDRISVIVSNVKVKIDEIAMMTMNNNSNRFPEINVVRFEMLEEGGILGEIE